MTTQKNTQDRVALLQGTLDILILKTLLHGPCHGQGVARSIQRQSEETFFVDHGYDLKALLTHIVSSRAYHSRPGYAATEDSGDGYVFRGPEVKRMTAEQFLDAVWMVTGTAPKKPDAEIKPPRETVAPPSAGLLSRLR